MEHLSNESEPRTQLAFTEHHGIETDMTGCRSWNCWYEDRQYALWEINYESPDALGAELPYYRLNWRSYNKERAIEDWVEWQHVGDFCDFDTAVESARTHAGL